MLLILDSEIILGLFVLLHLMDARKANVGVTAPATFCLLCNNHFDPKNLPVFRECMCVICTNCNKTNTHRPGSVCFFCKSEFIYGYNADFTFFNKYQDSLVSLEKYKTEFETRAQANLNECKDRAENFESYASDECERFTDRIMADYMKLAAQIANINEVYGKIINILKGRGDPEFIAMCRSQGYNKPMGSPEFNRAIDSLNNPPKESIDQAESDPKKRIKFDLKRPILRFDENEMILFVEPSSEKQGYLVVREHSIKTNVCKDVHMIQMQLTGYSCARRGNHLYIVGGLLAGGIPINTIKDYNRTTNEVRQAICLRHDRLNCATIIFKGHLYVVGGKNDHSVIGSAERWDFADKLEDLKPLNHPRAGFLLIEFGGKLIAMGGIDSSDSNVKEIEVYDNENDVWVDYGSTEFPTNDSAAIVLNNKIYITGGCRINTTLARRSTYVWDPLDDSTQILSDEQMLIERKNHMLILVTRDGVMLSLMALRGYKSDGTVLTYNEELNLAKAQRSWTIQTRKP